VQRMNDNSWPNFGLLSRKELKDIYDRLLYYAARRLRRAWWSGGRDPREFVHESFKKAINGQRNWDRTKSLYDNLRQIVSSEINHAAQHAAQSYEGKNVDTLDDAVVYIKDYRESQEDMLIYKSQVTHLLKFIYSKDRDAGGIAEIILHQGILKSSELGIQINKSVREIENIKKRLRRLCRLYQEEQQSDASIG
jgi:hypothetical protein